MSNDFIVRTQASDVLKIKLSGSIIPVGSIHYDTTANWNAKAELIGQKDHIYIYSDYTQKDGKNVPAIKAGDGVTLLINTPFTTVDLSEIETALEGKVDKETGKGLSTNDFTDALKDKLDGIESGAQVNTVTGVKGSAEADYRTGNIDVTKANIGLGNVDNTSDADKPISTAVQTALNGKVDKETGKGLSTNDFTDALKTKLDGIEPGAEANVQPDWNVSDTSSDAFIKNKPAIPTKTSDLTNDSGFITEDDVPVKGVKGSAESTYRTGNVSIDKTNIGLGNVDNTSDANKPISTATQAALDQKVDKVTGKGLSTNDYTNADRDKLQALPTNAELNTALNAKVDKVDGKGLSENDYTTAEKTKLAGIEAGAQVNTLTGVKGDAEATYRTGDVNITKDNIGLGNVDNTSDLNKPISTATQTELDKLTTGLSSAVKSVNTETPDANGNVAVKAENIPANGMGTKETSGNPIEIEDGVAGNAVDLSVDIEPIQDLHGYDHPWPAGGGKNLCDPTVIPLNGQGGTTYVQTTLPVGSVVAKIEGGKTYTISVKNAQTIFTSTCATYPTVGAPMVDVYAGSGGVSVNSKTITTSSGANYLVVNTGGYNYEEIQIEEGSSATSYEPYSNICPISGYDSVSVLRRGFNQWDEQWEQGRIDITTGEPAYSTTRIRSKNYIPATPNTAYYWKMGNQGLAICYYDADKNFISGAWERENEIYTTPNNACYIKFCTGDGNGGSYNTPICINISNPSRNGEYEPYAGQSVTVQLGQTVYGGTLDVNTGALVVDTWYEEYDGSSDEQWSSYADRFYITPSYLYRTDSQSNCKSNMYRYIGFVSGSQALTDTSTFGLYKDTGQTLNRVYLYDTRYANVTELKAALAIEPLTVCYELATPITFNLTPAQLALLEGYNIITSNADTIHLKYLGSEASDVQAEIDEFENVTYKLTTSIAPIEQTTAIATHAVGDYIMLNGEFCKVISAIAVGETITIGTNVSHTTIADELKAIIAQLGA